jgi:hypothetical protein
VGTSEGFSWTHPANSTKDDISIAITAYIFFTISPQILSAKENFG